MKPTYVSNDSDLRMLQMENELLTYEVRHLRARLEGRSEHVGLAKSRDQLIAERAEYQQMAAERLYELNATKEKLRRTQHDLKRIVGRVDRSPLGILLRRRAAYQRLRARAGLAGTS